MNALRMPVLVKNNNKNTVVLFVSTVAVKIEETFHNDISNYRVKSLSKQGLLTQALEIFRLTNQQGIPSDKYCYASLLQCCIGAKALREGRLVHAHIIQTGFTLSVYLETKLVILYAKCGSVENARQLFEKMRVRNVITWTTMIAAYARQRQSEEVLKLFDQMQRSGIQPDPHTFTSVLMACASKAALLRGRDLHEEIAVRGYESDVFVGSALVDMYVKCGSLDDARQVFQKMPVLDEITWGVMIGGYMQNGHFEEALGLYQQMQSAGTKANTFIFTRVLHACATLRILGLGKKIHEDATRGGCQSDIFVGNSLVDMYCKCGSIEDARNVFDKMTERNVITYTAMISGFVQCGQLWEAVKLFEETPDPNVMSWTAMISGYLQNGLVDEALKLFQKMPERDVISWSAMIVGYSQNGCFHKSLMLFQQMHVSGVKSNAETFAGVLPACTNLAALFTGMELHDIIVKLGFQSDLLVGNALLDMYVKLGIIEDACKVFLEMSVQDVISWNVMIAGYAQSGRFEKALQFFQHMQLKIIKPNSNTFASILPACANLASLRWGEEVHEHIIRTGFQSDEYVGSALVDMYAKCGRIDEAHRVFDKMPSRDIVIWNAMLAGYAMHGYGNEALQLFESTECCGVKPDDLTFLGILFACCHAGLVDDGRKYFVCMTHDYQMKPALKHYGCMVDLLGRAGQLDEAWDLINKMPMKPDVAVWGSLLGACGIHINIGIGEYAAEHLFELDPRNGSHYVALSNMYAAAGRWDDVKRVRKMMKDRKVLRAPGSSWIEINNQVHAFLTGNK